MGLHAIFGCWYLTMSRVVRQSKFRHVFGKAAKKEFIYDNLKPTKSAWDSNKCQANGSFVAVQWDSRGGGSFGVLPNDKVGKYPSDLGLVSGHKGQVLDISWNPFNDSIIGSVSEDGNGRIWQIPDGGLEKTHLTDPVQSLVGHRRKVGTIHFNPTANNVVATSSADYTVKVWDVETGSANLSITGHSEMIQCLDWNRNGSLMLTTSKDKQFRLIDPRAQTIDTASGILMPFFDNDTNMLYLAGKGDGNIRYYEMTNDKPFLHFLSEYKSNTPQLGMAFRPKTACNVSVCEVGVV